MDYLRAFQREAALGKLANVEKLALYIAGAAYPALDVTEIEDQLDDLAYVIERGMPDNLSGRQWAENFMDLLSTHMGFVGNRENYYDPRNSFLNDVLDRRTGLPITLSLVCMALGHRLHRPIHGVGYPGHFMAALPDGENLWLLDLFTARVLSPEEVPGHLSILFQQPLNFIHQMHAAPVNALSLARRILNNLWNIYHARGEFSDTAWVLDYMLALTPDDPRLWQERGVTAYQAGRLLDAARSLRRYLYLTGHLSRFLGLDGGIILEDGDGVSIDLGLDELRDPAWGDDAGDETASAFGSDSSAEAESSLHRGGYRSAPEPAEGDEVWQILGLLSQINDELQRIN